MKGKRMSDEKVIDSLSANEFAVEIDGVRAAGILSISDLVTFRLDVKPSLTKLEHPPFRIGKLVQQDANAPFNVWVRETTGAGADIMRPKRTLTILALDEGVETRRWTIQGAWISEISYSKFDSGSSDLVEETLKIHYDAIEEQFPTARLQSGD
jgi:hypothetical protein